ncbi:ABC transporter ATP-binding protein [Actinospica robiniae]|uniref:ABC transporter ATP-binding protein n=1 Tax=Actinospica robiniae TaxID=304901 RepID=UPI0003FBBA72|nr:ATP-binding cassette domain-containing protein [Actinospica robiniae]
MAVIDARGLTKVFRQPDKKPGWAGSFKHVVSRTYQEKVAVDGIDLRVEPGEAVAYVGPNGAGKSTTVKLLCGILVPTAGQVRIDGMVPHEQRAAVARRIGVLFGQRTQLWWDLSVADSLATLREIYSVPESVYRTRLARFDEVLGLEDILPVTGRKLSLGQRVRADLAAALLHDPGVLYLDEPTIGLDVAVKERVRAFLRSLGDEGVTVMLTSHDLQDIEDVCRRLVIIDAGRIIFDGDLVALKDQFAKERVLRLEMADAIDVAALGALLPACEVGAGEHARAVTVRFDRFTTTAGQIVSAVGTLAEITDFQVEEPSIEDVIRRVYAGELLARAEPNEPVAAGDLG